MNLFFDLFALPFFFVFVDLSFCILHPLESQPEIVLTTPVPAFGFPSPFFSLCPCGGPCFSVLSQPRNMLHEFLLYHMLFFSDEFFALLRICIRTRVSTASLWEDDLAARVGLLEV